MAEVESFTLDHNKVIAPYVRKITEEVGEKGGDTLYLYQTLCPFGLARPQPFCGCGGGLPECTFCAAKSSPTHLWGDSF